jgi:nucleoside-diphosphate-sugar epimerase
VQREDVVRGLISIIGNEKTEGKTLHLSGPAFSYEEPCTYIAEKLGIDIEKVTVPDAYPFEIDYSLTTELTGWEPEYDICAMIDKAISWRNTREECS